MSFFFKVLTGAVVGGSATLYYRDQISTTTTKLSSDLDRLSQQLVKSSQVVESPVEAKDGTGSRYLPKRIPLSEEIKARWNEQLYSTYSSISRTNWSEVTRRSWMQLKSLGGQAKDELEPAKEEVERVAQGFKEGGPVNGTTSRVV